MERINTTEKLHKAKEGTEDQMGIPMEPSFSEVQKRKIIIVVTNLWDMYRYGWTKVSAAWNF